MNLTCQALNLLFVSQAVVDCDLLKTKLELMHG